jgi:hypothetical protein
MFPVYGGSVCGVKRLSTGSRNVANISLMRKRLKRRCGNGWDDSQKDFYAAGFEELVKRGTSVSMLVKDISRNKCSFLPVLFITCFIFYINLWHIYWLSLVSKLGHDSSLLVLSRSSVVPLADNNLETDNVLKQPTDRKNNLSFSLRLLHLDLISTFSSTPFLSLLFSVFLSFLPAS